MHDFYRNLSKNKLIILPDPALVPANSVPIFEIFSGNFNYTRKFEKYKNSVTGANEDMIKKSVSNCDFH